MGFRVWETGFGDLGFRISGFEFWAWGLGFGSYECLLLLTVHLFERERFQICLVWSFMIQGLGFRV